MVIEENEGPYTNMDNISYYHFNFHLDEHASMPTEIDAA
jgi:hypothetical protein